MIKIEPTRFGRHGKRITWSFWKLGGVFEYHFQGPWFGFINNAWIRRDS
jgi:hypothetical protein